MVAQLATVLSKAITDDRLTSGLGKELAPQVPTRMNAEFAPMGIRKRPINLARMDFVDTKITLLTNESVIGHLICVDLSFILPLL